MNTADTDIDDRTDTLTRVTQMTLTNSLRQWQFVHFAIYAKL